MITLLLLKENETLDISSLVEQVKWSGRKGAATRTIEVSLLDSHKCGLMRSGIDVEDGNRCIFYWKGVELFQGLIMSQQQTNKMMMNIKAYDLGVHLAKNKDTFTYNDMTGSQIFTDCCARLGLPIGEVASTGYVITELPKPKTTHFDVIQDALSQTYKATGQRFFVLAKNGKVNLIKRKDNVLQWVIETGVNLSAYNFKKSIENVKTRVKIVSSKNEMQALEVSAGLERKYGIFQEVHTPSDELNKAQLDELAKSMAEEKGQTQKTLSISGIGIPEIISGICVYTIIEPIGISQTFYVEQDSHTFKGNNHTMSLTLNWTY